MNTVIDPHMPAIKPGVGSRESDKSMSGAEIRIKGRNIRVPSVDIGGRTVVTTGKWLKTASVREEDLIEGDTLADPGSFIHQLKQSGLKADLFTFCQRLPDVVPKHPYHIEWGNAAAVPITSHADWLKARTDQSFRKGVNRAKKLGVTVEATKFSDSLVEAICHIYDETPVRQGKAFWHYQKDFESVKNAMGTYLDRSVFLCAQYNGEMIGFMKLTCVGSVATITQILSMKKHFDKRPNNALISAAVDHCATMNKSHFIYGDFVYFDPDSSLTEFKRRGGFERIDLPRYYVPLSITGAVALRLGFHRELISRLPRPLLAWLLGMRKAWFARKSRQGADAHQPA